MSDIITERSGDILRIGGAAAVAGEERLTPSDSAPATVRQKHLVFDPSLPRLARGDET